MRVWNDGGKCRATRQIRFDCFLRYRFDGIVLYELKGEKPFAAPQPATPEEALEIAEKHYTQWMEITQQFRATFDFAQEKSWSKRAAFDLHQTVERLYACLLLVLTNYSPPKHDVKFLRSLSEEFDPSLIEVWPRESRFERRYFELLKRAYVEARYSEHYKITEEELIWLGERAALLQNVVETICQGRIDELKKQAQR